MTVAPIVLVITADGVGGAEKRFCEVWLHLAPRHPELRLLVRQSTFEQLLIRPDLGGLTRYRHRIGLIKTGASSYPATMAAFALPLWRLPRGSVVHHVLQAPPLIHRLRGHRLLLSWVGTTFPRPREKPADWAVSTMSLRQANRIDVLNPDMFNQLGRHARIADKLSLTTGGTFVDFEHFRPATLKRDEVVFLGSLVRMRGIVPFVMAIPAIARRLKASGRSARFIILGNRGDASDEVERLLTGGEFRGIDVQSGTTSDPAPVLSRAKVFVALQTISNYPSKALAEAMACGCVPIITDVGESRLMADDGSAVFIQRNYEPEVLAKAVDDILSLDAVQFAHRSEIIRQAARQRFSLPVQADYFRRLYRDLTELPEEIPLNGRS